MRRSFLLALVLAAAGCARPPAPPSFAEQARIVRASTGEELGWDALVEELLGARAVYVGEQHDSVRDHEVERAIAQAIHARDPSLAIGLEMFDVRAQPALDAYVEGAIDEATFLERSAYEAGWGFDYALLRPLMEWARAHRVRVIALNVPRELTQAVARGGLASLSAEQRAALPREIALDHAAHRAMLDAALEGHPGMTEDQRARYYEAQVVWDEAMGSAVAEALARDPGLRRVVVFAGAFHVVRGLGIPRTAARRGADPFRVVLSIGPEEAAERLGASPEERGDDLLVVHPDETAPAGGRL